MSKANTPPLKHTWTIPGELLTQMTPVVVARVTDAIDLAYRTRVVHGLPCPPDMNSITIREMIPSDFPDPDQVTEKENYALTVAGATRIVAVVRTGFRVQASITLSSLPDTMYLSILDAVHGLTLSPTVLEAARKRITETLDAIGLGEFVGTSDVSILDLRRGRDGYDTVLSVAVQGKVKFYVWVKWKYTAASGGGYYEVETHVPHETLVVDRGEPDPNPYIHEY